MSAPGRRQILTGATPRSAWSATQADVIVIGAGLAGLGAAHLLEQAGLRITLVEARQRVGGRLFTLDDLEGAPEAGGIQVGSNYDRLTATAAAVGIGFDPAPPPDRPTRYRIGDADVTANAWSGLSANRLDDAERRIPPDALLRFYLARLPQHADALAWIGEEALAGDRSLAGALSDLGASEEARRLIDVNLNASSAASVSVAHFLRQAAVYRAAVGPIRMIRGGGQRLPEAMAGRLSGPVRLGCIVTAIDEAADGVDVRLADGGTLRAGHVLCTVPFAVLRTIALPSTLPPELIHHIATLPYVGVSQVHLIARGDAAARFPEILWTDDPMLGRVMRGPSTGDGVQLKIWYTGALVDGVDRANETAVARQAAARLVKAVPSLAGHLTVTGFTSWGNDPFARGAYHCVGAGQMRAHAAAVRHRGRRLHLAGEHLALETTGLEGALESGERAARTILDLS